MIGAGDGTNKKNPVSGGVLGIGLVDRSIARVDLGSPAGEFFSTTELRNNS
jgi:hypothetical protein